MCFLVAFSQSGLWQMASENDPYGIEFYFICVHMYVSQVFLCDSSHLFRMVFY